MARPSPILIVEDDHELRTALAQLLDIEGFDVVQAVNGLQALLALQAGLVPSVIILDLMMPVMDGSHLLAELARDPRLSAIPVIIMSASRRQAEFTEFPFWQKPSKVEILLGMIARAAPP